MASSPVPLKKKAPAVAASVQLDLPRWEDETISTVFNVTLKVCSSYLPYGTASDGCWQREVAEKTSYEVVWLKSLAEELQGEGMLHCLHLIY